MFSLLIYFRCLCVCLFLVEAARSGPAQAEGNPVFAAAPAVLVGASVRTSKMLGETHESTGFGRCSSAWRPRLPGLPNHPPEKLLAGF